MASSTDKALALLKASKRTVCVRKFDLNYPLHTAWVSLSRSSPSLKPKEEISSNQVDSEAPSCSVEEDDLLATSTSRVEQSSRSISSGDIVKKASFDIYTLDKIEGKFKCILSSKTMNIDTKANNDAETEKISGKCQEFKPCVDMELILVMSAETRDHYVQGLLEFSFTLGIVVSENDDLDLVERRHRYLKNPRWVVKYETHKIIE